MGESISAATAQVRAEPEINSTELVSLGGYSPWDAGQYSSLNGTTLTWPELYGPNIYHGDNFTNLFSLQYNDTTETLNGGNIVVSGYGNRSVPAKQPFKSEDIILFSDGACDSACSIFSHFLKWEGKVKQIAAGGRPAEGPMQAVGGTRGSRLEPFSDIYDYTSGVYQADPESFSSQANTTVLPTVLLNYPYVMGRTGNPIQAGLGVNTASVNLYNNIAQGDSSLTPLQFQYEAADCRIFWTAEMMFNVSSIWAMVADVWQGNFTECVANSVGNASSLSGNPALFNGGVATNVSSSQEPKDVPVPGSTLSATNMTTTISSATKFVGHVPHAWLFVGSFWLLVGATVS